jgi:hypothetical protein
MTRYLTMDRVAIVAAVAAATLADLAGRALGSAASDRAGR